jgi:L-alanine-DL-glutamate epimerase-like enolase superfamily enzyme
MDQDFKEKIDAMRMTLELAMHDIEGQRAAIQELRMLSASQNEGIQVLATASEALLKNADLQAKKADQQEIDLSILKKLSGELLQTAQIHERRIAGLEGRL